MPELSQSPITIRDAGPADVPRLLRIDHICFPPDIAYSRAEIVFFLTRRFAIAKAAEIAGDMAGFVIGASKPGAVAHVVTLDVMPQSRRHGVGTALMAALHEVFRLRRATGAILEVDTKNQAAVRFYLGLGYERGELLPGYYHGRSDAFLMRLRM